MTLKELINAYGNIELKAITGKPEFTHVRGKRLTSLCKRAKIDYAVCINGFKKSGGEYRAMKDGVIIYEGDSEKMNSEIEQHEKRNSPEVREKRRLAREKKYKKEEIDFARKIRENFPAAPEDVEYTIAERACEVGSGRVGRSEVSDETIHAAVVAHIRHQETDYDELLDGLKRKLKDGDEVCRQARAMVSGDISRIVNEWQTPTETEE